MDQRHMLLCLSSGYTPRYRHDVLRALALPSGARLRFRYSLDLIPESLKQDIGNSKLVGEEACIAYLDRSDPKRAVSAVPVRQAQVESAEVFGDFCIIEFNLSAYFVARDIDAFDADLKAAAGSFPRWDRNNPEEVTGKFCERLPRPLTSLVTSNSAQDWQSVCKTLAAHADFRDEPFFYRIESIRDLDSERTLSIDDGAYSVTSESLLEMRVLHYAPSIDLQHISINHTSWLVTEASTDLVSFVTSPRLAIDSGYDVKSIRMRAEAVTRDTDGMLTISRNPPGASGKEADGTWDFDLPIRVKRNIGKMLWEGTWFAMLVAGQGLVPIWANPNISNKVWPSIVAVILGVATSFFWVKNLRKP